jgi:hypothetical protein
MLEFAQRATVVRLQFRNRSCEANVSRLDLGINRASGPLSFIGLAGDAGISRETRWHRKVSQALPRRVRPVATVLASSRNLFRQVSVPAHPARAARCTIGCRSQASAS